MARRVHRSQHQGSCGFQEAALHWPRKDAKCNFDHLQIFRTSSCVNYARPRLYIIIMRRMNLWDSKVSTLADDVLLHTIKTGVHDHTLSAIHVVKKVIFNASKAPAPPLRNARLRSALATPLAADIFQLLIYFKRNYEQTT